MNTSIREAFLNAKVLPSANKQLKTACLVPLMRNTGQIKEGRGWTANLSMRTFKKLQAEGIFA